MLRLFVIVALGLLASAAGLRAAGEHKSADDDKKEGPARSHL